MGLCHRKRLIFLGFLQPETLPPPEKSISGHAGGINLPPALLFGAQVLLWSAGLSR
jgi:hypothetical protein